MKTTRQIYSFLINPVNFEAVFSLQYFRTLTTTCIQSSYKPTIHNHGPIYPLQSNMQQDKVWELQWRQSDFKTAYYYSPLIKQNVSVKQTYETFNASCLYNRIFYCQLWHFGDYQRRPTYKRVSHLLHFPQSYQYEATFIIMIKKIKIGWGRGKVIILIVTAS